MKKTIILLLAIVTLYSCAKTMAPTITKATPKAEAVSAHTAAVNLPDAVKQKNISNTTITEPTKLKAPIVAAEAGLKETPQIAEGKNVYKAKCGQCHELKDTEDYDAARWGKIVDWMAPKAKLDSKQKENVLAYVTFYAKK